MPETWTEIIDEYLKMLKLATDRIKVLQTENDQMRELIDTLYKARHKYGLSEDDFEQARRDI